MAGVPAGVARVASKYSRHDRRAADAGDLLIAEREICQRKELVAVRSERAAIAQREPDKIVLCLQGTPR